uniref:Uncharacterized protein n=1 Tax=Romanomermis culicivorax TaxID=13658 RepID=A0A915J6F8_ROMCU
MRRVANSWADIDRSDLDDVISNSSRMTSMVSTSMSFKVRAISRCRIFSETRQKFEKPEIYSNFDI